MSRKNLLPQLVTANDLLNGHVVFWTGRDWSPSSDEARIYADPDEQQSALAAAERDAGRVVGAYLAAVEDGDVVRLRERIRLTGPTIDYAGRTAAPGA